MTRAKFDWSNISVYIYIYIYINIGQCCSAKTVYLSSKLRKMNLYTEESKTVWKVKGHNNIDDKIFIQWFRRIIFRVNNQSCILLHCNIQDFRLLNC